VRQLLAAQLTHRQSGAQPALADATGASLLLFICHFCTKVELQRLCQQQGAWALLQTAAWRSPSLYCQAQQVSCGQAQQQLRRQHKRQQQQQHRQLPHKALPCSSSSSSSSFPPHLQAQAMPQAHQLFLQARQQLQLHQTGPRPQLHPATTALAAAAAAHVPQAVGWMPSSTRWPRCVSLRAA
jgi:hypothetical protein